MQQLALFSEYGRMAFEAEEKAAATGVIDMGDKDGEGETKEHIPASSKKKVSMHSPFQKIEFLIRDWQNFDTEDETDIASMEAEMAGYLEHVVREREASDLKDTREQINSCFEEISCFMLTHPGFAVIKNKVSSIFVPANGVTQVPALPRCPFHHGSPSCRRTLL